jgi:PHP family Zn ribbon phosphoesterase
MAPESVMLAARDQHLDIVSITDHNSMQNSLVYRQSAQKHHLSYIFGVEIQTGEEIHLIALFDDWTLAEEFNDELYQSLIPIKNDPEFFGDQVVIDQQTNILKFEEKALLNSSTWSVEETVHKVREKHGFIFPAHVDHDSYSILSQLGFIPEELELTALGISASCDIDKLLAVHPQLSQYSLIRNSDAHYLKDIGAGFSEFYLQEPSLAEIVKACRKEGTRSVKIINSGRINGRKSGS